MPKDRPKSGEMKRSPWTPGGGNSPRALVRRSCRKVLMGFNMELIKDQNREVLMEACIGDQKFSKGQGGAHWGPAQGDADVDMHDDMHR